MRVLRNEKGSLSYAFGGVSFIQPPLEGGRFRKGSTNLK